MYMINYDNEDWFIGLPAEKESQTLARNNKDSKVSNTVQVLIAAALSELAIEDTVKIMMAVPYKSFRKSGFFIFSILSIDNILYYIV